jgi:hypothetical protein
VIGGSTLIEKDVTFTVLLVALDLKLHVSSDIFSFVFGFRASALESTRITLSLLHSHLFSESEHLRYTKLL